MDGTAKATATASVTVTLQLVMNSDGSISIIGRDDYGRMHMMACAPGDSLDPAAIGEFVLAALPD